MAEKGKRRSAAYRALAGLMVLVGAFQAGCHSGSDNPDNAVQAPTVSYRSPVILATAGETFTSVAPDAQAYVHYDGVGTIITTGITFTVSPDLPAGLSLDRTSGVIAGVPPSTSSRRHLHRVRRQFRGGPAPAPSAWASRPVRRWP